MKKKTAKPEEVSPPTLLATLAAARPHAERLVFELGIVPGIAAATDAALAVMEEWRESQLTSRQRSVLRAIEGDLYDVALASQDAGYLLGIAVGLLLRPQSQKTLTLDEAEIAGGVR